MARRSTTVVKHSLLIAGHRTSVSLEPVFWTALQRQAGMRNVTVAALVADIDARRGEANLSSAIRVHLFETLSGASGDPHLETEGQHVS